MRIIRVQIRESDQRTARAAAPAGLLTVRLAACGADSASASGKGPDDSTSPPTPAGRSAAARLDEPRFTDTAPSASGRPSCATCHIAANPFTAASASGPAGLSVSAQFTAIRSERT